MHADQGAGTVGGDDRGGRGRPLRVVSAASGDLLTVREFAAVLRMSTATVYKLVATGELSHVRVGNSIRISRAAIGGSAVPGKR